MAHQVPAELMPEQVLRPPNTPISSYLPRRSSRAAVFIPEILSRYRLKLIKRTSVHLWHLSHTRGQNGAPMRRLGWRCFSALNQHPRPTSRYRRRQVRWQKNYVKSIAYTERSPRRWPENPGGISEFLPQIGRAEVNEFLSVRKTADGRMQHRKL